MLTTISHVTHQWHAELPLATHNPLHITGAGYISFLNTHTHTQTHTHTHTQTHTHAPCMLCGVTGAMGDLTDLTARDKAVTLVSSYHPQPS